MSMFNPALNFMLDNEDRQRKYASVPDVGGYAISGVNSHSFPAQYAAIAAVPQAQRGPAVANFYETVFWVPLNIQGVADQDVANRVLDQSVNGGPKTGPMLLQQAANSFGGTLTVDGVLGPDTLEVVNAINPANLLAAFRTARENRYRSIAARNPDLGQYLNQWLARAAQ